MDKIVGLVSTNFTTEGFGALLDERPLASLPFGGRYRLMDFALSNLVNSGLRTVGLITPYFYRSILDHVGVGKEWSLSRKEGGMYILPGSIYGFKNLYAKFLIRDLLQNLPFFERSGCKYIILSGTSKIFNFDYRPMLEQHEESGSEVTLLYKKSAESEDRDGLYMDINDAGSVTGISEKPGSSLCVFLDSLIINADIFYKLLDWYKALSYMDLMDVLIENLDKLKVASYNFKGYVGMIDTVYDYMKCSQDVLTAEVNRELFSTERSIYTKVQDNPPAKYVRGCHVSNSSIATGCIIEGTVENSILFRSVHVAKNAVVKNCIIMQSSDIGEQVRMENVICDKFVTISSGAQLAGNPAKPFIIGKKQNL